MQLIDAVTDNLLQIEAEAEGAELSRCPHKAGVRMVLEYVLKDYEPTTSASDNNFIISQGEQNSLFFCDV
jgi:hypothetical protein